ncbi:MAG: hypothetical protein EXX96DRAFT_622549 [Benjaminiella poitrasii]|nr:MAG: hypothetical protein EXX96DRAFT_622549 [Benjaminiella poitrasii]
MTVTLYPWPIEQIDQFKYYLAKHTPTTSSLLGYLIGTNSFTLDHPRRIWTSHSDPLNTSDIVVWIIDGKRTRFFVNTEPTLEMAPMNLTAATVKTHKGAYFVDEADEYLFQQSLTVVEQVMSYYISRHGNDQSTPGIELGDVNMLWYKAFLNISGIKYESFCFKFVKQASLDSTHLKLPAHLKVTELNKKSERDVDLVQTKNKILFDRDYVEDCFCMTSVIRRVDTNEPVAWAMTHRDLYVGSLHVLPDYRRQGLAEAVLTDITRKYSEYFHKSLPDVPVTNMYSGACVETFNLPSASLFKKSGWKQLGLGVLWLYCRQN